MSYINKIDKEYIKYLVEKGGPDLNEYDELNAFFIRIGDLVRNGKADRKNVNCELWQLLGDAVSPQTMQGKVVVKTHGYAGDYEIIDNIYTSWISPEPHLAYWDHFFHSQAATNAVRNRKQYFIELLKEVDKKNINGSSVLSVGSGPARDIFDFCSLYGIGKINFDCLDMDSNAIKYSKQILREYTKFIVFHYKNIFRFRPKESYNLIWVAGLFDYLDDRRFVFLLKHLRSMVVPEGCLIVGNFSTYNPSRDYMEAGDWYLSHRSKEKMYYLARESGILDKNICIKFGPEKVNLFMSLTE